MTRLRVSLACGVYDRTLGLRDGSVQPEGIDLNYFDLRPTELFWRMVRHQEFDAAEMSLSAHIMNVSRGDERLVGIPVFPLRVFRHAFVFVNQDARISSPEDLRGKRVGVPEYHMTAALFARGFLADDYQVRPNDIHWFQGGVTRPGRMERVELDLPSGVTLEVVQDRTLDDMLAAGAIDALVSASVPPSFGKYPKVRRLFADPMPVELDWYRRTGIFPIMHLVVVRRSLLDHNPWVAVSLMKAFERAKQQFLSSLDGRGAALSALPFHQLHVEEAMEVFSRDFIPYGTERNMATLEAALRYSHEQGLSARRVDVQELFAETTLKAQVSDN